MTQKPRPGTIAGKTKATFYLDEDVHRALRMKAAETGDSMSDIAENAIRRELGMTNRYTCYTCNGDFAEGYWLDTGEAEHLFYCDECAKEAGIRDNARRQEDGTYRAAYWTDGSAEVVLTAPEHAGMTDAELIEEARREADRQGLDLTDGKIVVGEWKD